MKKVFLPLLVAIGIALAGCGTTQNDTSAVAATPETAVIGSDSTAEPAMEPATAIEASASVSPAPEAAAEAPASADDDSACDKFLTDYEDYANSYAVLAAKYTKNPMDMTIMQKYTDMATKAQQMKQDKPDACEADVAFMKRYTRITAKVTKAMAAQTAGSAKMMEQMSKQMGQ
ncbi:hypothetical protein [Hymenobacter siberiensis]|uniref:hypothetical protein n=1 Tax=Hymenobacter siberiensis TaxID=2848396 RepID=UPI001C1DE23D|nr:hypothetical protein [Hymenobacter siberiensis]